MPTIAVTIVDQTVAVTQVGEIGPTGATGATGTVSAAGDGTAGAPGIAFASDTDTGIFRAGTNILGVTTGGTERVRVDASGNVGIGTAAPGSRLTVSGGYISQTDGTISTFLGSDAAGSLFGTTTNHYLRFVTNNDERLRILPTGEVGIGTTSPTTRLTVSGGYISQTDGTIRTFMGSDTVGSLFGTVTNHYLRFVTNDEERLRIAAAGTLTPGTDNTQNFGSGSLRWATIFAGTGTINTSDERYKVLREGGDLSDAEYRAWSAVRAIVYRDKDSFERKGDAARLHIGYSWQSIQAAVEAEGLDAARYGLWCEDALEAPVEKTRTATRPVEGQTETVPVLDDDGEPVFEQVQETEEVEQPFEEVRMIDGAPVLVKGVRTVAQPVFDSLQIRDEDGELVFTDPDPETGEPIPRMAPVPRMITRAKTETVPVMEEYEQTYTEMEPTGETRGALRYSQCSVIEAAWLRRELASLTARVSALEAV
jgi:hypothetical protein